MPKGRVGKCSMSLVYEYATMPKGRVGKCKKHGRHALHTNIIFQTTDANANARRRNRNL